MPRATCRCGQKLSVPVDGPDRVICPKCSARIRVRKSTPKLGTDDGFVRFSCPCGQRLKVRVIAGLPLPQAGKCPECGATVPVPEDALVKPSSSAVLRSVPAPVFETPTEELNAADLAALESWAQSHLAKAAQAGVVSESNGQDGPGSESLTTDHPGNTPVPEAPPPPPARRPGTTVKVEAGLRVCPRCGRPIHLGADNCRECGAHVPRR
jgi:hypothetical protein